MKILATTRTSGKKKIGIDFHGVINTDPVFFQKLAQELLRRHIEVHIISGGPEDYIKNYLQDNGILYSQIWCIYSYYENKGQITIYEDGSFYMDDEIWNKAKADYCRRHKIGLHIDDSLIYGKYFTTPYCLYNGNTKTGQILDCQIAFSESAELCADQLMSVLK